MHEGQQVLIRLPLKDPTIITAMRKYDGKVATIQTKRGVRFKNSYTQYVYTLRGITGNCKQPYLFVEGWLIPLEEGDE